MKAKIIHILCEGQTEQGFVEEVLRPYLQDKGIKGIKSTLIETNKKKNARGGLLSYNHALTDLRLLQRTKIDGDFERHIFTTMFDFYALPAALVVRDIHLERVGSGECEERCLCLGKIEVDDGGIEQFLSVRERNDAEYAESGLGRIDEVECRASDRVDGSDEVCVGGSDVDCELPGSVWNEGLHGEVEGAAGRYGDWLGDVIVAGTQELDASVSGRSVRVVAVSRLRALDVVDKLGVCHEAVDDDDE